TSCFTRPSRLATHHPTSHGRGPSGCCAGRPTSNLRAPETGASSSALKEAGRGTFHRRPSETGWRADGCRLQFESGFHRNGREEDYPEGGRGVSRPLGVPALEDKVVQRAVVEVLDAIYEVDFLGFSYGFRPGRSPHQALEHRGEAEQFLTELRER